MILQWASHWWHQWQRICLYRPCQCRRHGFYSWVRKISWRRARQPTPVFLPGESHRQRSLVSSGPEGCKELDVTEVPYHTHMLDPAILFWSIYPEKTLTWKDICTPVFTAAIFTIAMTCKQPKCPWTDEWIRKMWNIYIQWNITQS